MSAFYCGYHGAWEDSDFVGYNENDHYDSGAVCDEAMWELEDIEYQLDNPVPDLDS